MAFRLRRRFVKDDNAADIGLLMLVFPFVLVSILMLATNLTDAQPDFEVGIPITSMSGSHVLPIPDDYDSMSEQERYDYLADTFGGYPHGRGQLGTGAAPIYAMMGTPEYFEYPDGTCLEYYQVVDYCKNDTEHLIEAESGKSFLNQVVQLMTLNYVGFEYIGAFGVALRAILALCVIIGFIDLIWW